MATDYTPIGPVPSGIANGTVDATSRQLARDMRGKAYGKDVRETIARMTEWHSIRSSAAEVLAAQSAASAKISEASAKQSAQEVTQNAQGSIRLINDALVQQKQKIETGIKDITSEYALLRPQAITAIAKADAADALSKSVQSQFNQVVIEGDSSVEAAQARVDASGHTSATLKERLDKEHTKVTTQLAQKAPKAFVNVKDFGATGNGTTDDTQAIRNAINSMIFGGTLFFPTGTYLVSQIDTNNFIFKIEKPIKIVGEGFVSSIRIKAGTPNTCDVFYVNPNMNFGGEFYGVEKLLIYPQVNTDGRYAFHFDVSLPGKYMSKFYMCDVYVQNHGSKAIRVTNAEDKADGFFASTFERCVLMGGVDLERSGDSIVFRDCTITGKGRGIRVKSVSIPVQQNFASQFILDNCNITADGGALLVEFAKNVTVIGGNVEQTKLFAGHVIDVSGTDHEVVNFTMERTHLTVFGESGNQCNNIRIDNVNKAEIDKCSFANETGGINVLIDENAKNVTIGNNRFEGGIKIVDKGQSTVGVIKPLTLINNWTEFNGRYYSKAGYFKDRDGWVHLKGLLKDGTVTAGTIISNLPLGYRPKLIIPFFIPSDNLGTLIMSEIQVKDNGEIVIQSGGNTRLSLDGIKFLAEQ